MCCAKNARVFPLFFQVVRSYAPAEDGGRAYYQSNENEVHFKRGSESTNGILSSYMRALFERQVNLRSQWLHRMNLAFVQRPYLGYIAPIRGLISITRNFIRIP